MKLRWLVTLAVACGPAGERGILDDGNTDESNIGTTTGPDTTTLDSMTRGEAPGTASATEAASTSETEPDCQVEGCPSGQYCAGEPTCGAIWRCEASSTCSAAAPSLACDCSGELAVVAAGCPEQHAWPIGDFSNSDRFGERCDSSADPPFDFTVEFSLQGLSAFDGCQGIVEHPRLTLAGPVSKGTWAASGEIIEVMSVVDLVYSWTLRFEGTCEHADAGPFDLSPEIDLLRFEITQSGLLGNIPGN